MRQPIVFKPNMQSAQPPPQAKPPSSPQAATPVYHKPTYQTPGRPDPLYTDPRICDLFYLKRDCLAITRPVTICNQHRVPILRVNEPLYSRIFTCDITMPDGQLVMTMKQDSFWQLRNLAYTLYDPSGSVIGTIRRSGWVLYYRGIRCAGQYCWQAFDAKGLEVVQSVDKTGSLGRYPFTRAGVSLGKFTRRIAPTEYDTLDLSKDKNRWLDRRIALALAVLMLRG